jgi:hypothetical protein
VSAAADALQFDDAVRLSCFAKRRRGDVINRDANGRFAIENSIVSVTVEDGVHFESIDWLFQSAGPEKRINLRIFAL